MNKKFGLPYQIIESINQVLAQNNKIEKIILYGSRAKGNYKNGSDIDLTLVAPQLSTSDLLKLENILDDLLLPYKIDLSLFHQIENPHLLEHITRVGVPFTA